MKVRYIAVLHLGLFSAMLPEGALAAAPIEQWAIVQAGTGGAEALNYKKVPMPQPGEGQVLVKVYAAAVNPVDWKSRTGIVGVVRPAGTAAGEGQPTITAPTPGNTRIPGSDVAGVVEKLGSGVTQFKVGDKVFASVGRSPGSVSGVLNGGYAEYAVTSVANVIAKPDSMTFAQASGLGTATTTGLNAVNRGRVSAGQRVLIAGAAGGVGSAALQVAKGRGAYVIAIASGRHADYLEKLGADEIYDYTKVAWQDKISNVDVVIDTVSAENAARAIKTLRKGGKLVSIVGRVDVAECTAAGVDCGSNQQSGPPAAAPGGADAMSTGTSPAAAGTPAGAAAVMAAGGGGQTAASMLAKVIKLANAGKFIINVDDTFPLTKAFDAQEENRNGGTQGKIVLVVDADKANTR